MTTDVRETWADLLAKSKGPWHTAAPEARPKFAEPDTEFLVDTRAVSLKSSDDTDIAQAFAQVHHAELKYVPELKAWVFWDQNKGRWVRDVAGDVSCVYRLKLWMDGLLADVSARAHAAKLAEGGSQADATKAAALARGRMKTAKKVRDVYGLVKSEPCMITSVRHFDADPWLLNTPDGPLDLWTGEMFERSSDELCLKQTAVAPQVGETPLWEKVLNDAFPGDPETQEYVETVLSLALVGDQSIQHFWMLSGEAGSGKGTLLNTLMSLMGTSETGYAMPVEAEFLMQQKGQKHPEQYARLKGKRLVVSSESSSNQAFDAARVKNLTGDDIQSGRWMGGNTFSFKPTWKLFLMTNYRPRVDPEDGGFWRRFREIPFRHKPAEPIAGLQSRLIDEEGPAILARLLLRLMDFVQAGGVHTPETVKNATQENKAEQDTVVEFIHEMCDVSASDGDLYVMASSLFEEYVKWSKLNNYATLTSNMFGRRVTKLGFATDRKKVNGKTVVVRLGVRLVQEASIY